MYRIGDGIPPSFNLSCDSDVVKKSAKKFGIRINKPNHNLGGFSRGLFFGGKEWGGGVDKITPSLCLKLCRIMLET